MSYAVDFSPRFASKWGGLPPEVAEHVLDQLDALATNPAARSRPSEVPADHFQLFRFRGAGSDAYVQFEVRFQYSQDEELLHILDLAWVSA